MRTLLGFNISQKLFVAVNNIEHTVKYVFPVNTVVQISTAYYKGSNVLEVARNEGGETWYTTVSVEMVYDLVESGELVLVEGDEVFGGVKFE